MHTITEINSLKQHDFIELFGNLVENDKLCAAAIWSDKPFEDEEHIHSCICNFIETFSIKGKQGILRLHPDLAGKLATENRLTIESREEQISAGLNDLSEGEKALLAGYNSKYLNKFGFPFVICARENKKEMILKSIQERLQNTIEEETQAGIEEVKKICYFRLLHLVKDEIVSKM